MASTDALAAVEIRRFPLSNYVDAVRFLPAVSAFDRPIAAAVHDPDSSSLNLYSLHHDDLLPIYSFPLPSPVSSLSLSSSTHHPVLAVAAARSGALHLLTLQPSSTSHRSVSDGAFHAGAISAVDVQADGGACVTVGTDGRVNLVRVGESQVSYERVGDARGLREFTAVRWGSEWEFTTGGLGYGVQWWDQRKPGGIVSQFKGFDW